MPAKRKRSHDVDPASKDALAIAREVWEKLRETDGSLPCFASDQYKALVRWTEEQLGLALGFGLGNTQFYDLFEVPFSGVENLRILLKLLSLLHPQYAKATVSQHLTVEDHVRRVDALIAKAMEL